MANKMKQHTHYYRVKTDTCRCGKNYGFKQRINIEQLNELSEKGKKQLNMWCFKKGHLKLESVHEDPYLKPFPLLSIGQMIEFLDEKRKVKKGRNKLIFIDKDARQWHICFSFDCDGLKESEELCNALWEAVKEILEGGDKDV